MLPFTYGYDHSCITNTLPCIPLNGFGASSSGYFLNFGVGLIVLATMFSWVTCLRVPIQGALPYKSSSEININMTWYYIWWQVRNRLSWYGYTTYLVLPSESSFFCRLPFWLTCRRLPAHGVCPASSMV